MTRPPAMTDTACFSPRLGDSLPTALQLEDEARSPDRFATRLTRITRKPEPCNASKP